MKTYFFVAFCLFMLGTLASCTQSPSPGIDDWYEAVKTEQWSKPGVK